MSLYLCDTPEGSMLIGCGTSAIAAELAGIPFEPDIPAGDPIDGVKKLGVAIISAAIELNNSRREASRPAGSLALNS